MIIGQESGTIKCFGRGDFSDRKHATALQLIVCFLRS